MERMGLALRIQADQVNLDGQRPERRLVDSVFQGFTSFETWDLGSSDLDRLASLRVTAGTSSALFDGESTEANQHHRVTGLQSASNGFDYCVQRTASDSFRDISGCGDGINQFRLVHS